MKKGFLAIVCSAAIILLAGCSQNSGTTVQNIDTSNVPDTSMVRPEDYPDNLSGLEKYFAAMNYLPENAEPTTMMYKVIGAIAGDRYTFSVNGSAVTVELYEYNTKKLPKEAKRVISEVKKDGSFYVLESDTEDSAKVSAVLSDDDQFLMIYTDNSSAGANQSRKSEVEAALKSFNGNSGTSQTSKPDETSKQTSQSSDTKESSDNSKVTSDTEESSDHWNLPIIPRKPPIQRNLPIIPRKPPIQRNLPILLRKPPIQGNLPITPRKTPTQRNLIQLQTIQTMVRNNFSGCR